MGGNALKEFDSKRLPASRHAELSSKLATALDALMLKLGVPGHANMVQSYREKPDHGDIDVVLPTTLRAASTDSKIGEELASALGTSPWPFLANGGVVSYGIPLEEGGVFQVDLIYLPDYEVDFAVKYFAWNDVGNLIGRIAHKMGLRFGHNGLHMPLRDGNYLFDTLVVTRDFDAAMTFLGFNAARWQEGFDNLEAIFNFTVDNPRFASKLYLLEERNHTARVRDKKRPTYTKFLKWLAEHPEKDSGFDWPEDKSVWLPEIFEAFPGLKPQWDVSNENLARARLVKEKYNGDRITELTGLTNKDLGNFIKNHHASFASKDAFNAWVYESEQSEIDSQIVKRSKA
jgi:hypothetical protein